MVLKIYSMTWGYFPNCDFTLFKIGQLGQVPLPLGILIFHRKMKGCEVDDL